MHEQPRQGHAPGGDRRAPRSRLVLPRLSDVRIKLDVRISQEIVDESVTWIAHSPAREVGGKLVGRINGSLDAAGPDVIGQVEALRLDVIHHLDAGPGASRTATYHLPDGRYQEAVFRAIEAKYPDVRHLGSWHSHHPNGLHRFSQGDINGYTRDVNNPMHSHDLFLAALAADGHGLARARYFLFIRGLDEYFQIDPAAVRIVRSYNPYSEIILSCRRDASGAVDQRPPATPAPKSQRRGMPGLQMVMWLWALILTPFRRTARSRGESNDDQPGGQPMSTVRDASAPNASRPDTSGTASAAAQPAALPEWTGTKAGRDALAVDRAWISADHPEFRLVNRSGTLLWTGVKEYDEMTLAVTLAYPGDYPASSPIVDVTGRTDRLDVKVQAILRSDDDTPPYRRQLFTLLRSVAKVGDSPQGTSRAV